MKRTAEIVLTVIGIVLFGLPVIFSGIMLNAKENQAFQAEIERAVNSQDMNMQGLNVNQIIDMVGTVSIVIIVAALIAIALGILAIFFLKGDKKPKAAGIILIITAIVFTFATFGLGLFGAAPFLIAGIVALVRKKKSTVEDGGTIDY
ncbi:DUF4064 domain-containing protein [Halobacillus litoralis]|uniref:DUF4064 domain-containing protein n=1 Tax=Halobacillus litoralis TaxID=45668 RepID=A0A845DYA0_9BACI|nr:DUF4064 domain-containing protein [Halobacillus litoralis]MYL21799.1 DUF4064 domain-containing protein [Halobacillus litoralis]